MDFMQFLDLILQVDKTLGFMIKEYGTLIYLVLFMIVFCETGLVVMPFLPGDTLLFIGGAFCASGKMNIWTLMGLLIIAATTGNTLNYWIGSKIGEGVFTHDYRWLGQKSLQKTHFFYEHHGGKTVILSRFIPIVRTFAPFVAGVSKMTFSKFQFFNITGALIWVVGLVSAGYFFGNIPVIHDHLNTIVLVGVGAALIPVVLGGLWKLFKKIRGQRA
ncbi:MAG: VTT domain-containing protein [Glaciimonas sp.]|nr:VTT domain-containing protein [Glaciimonas sp.]